MNIGINKNIKRLSGIAAILMLAVAVIGCKHNVNNKPETFTVTFGVLEARLKQRSTEVKSIRVIPSSTAKL